MCLIIEKTFDFPFSENYSCIHQQLSDIVTEIFRIFGIDQIITSTKECREYVETVGWIPFPYSETKYIYYSDIALCTLIKTSMYNGHIGDTEETIKLIFETENKKLNLFINLYTSAVSLKYKSEAISEALTSDIERLLQKTFNLSLRPSEKSIATNYDYSPSCSIDYNDHKNHK